MKAVTVGARMVLARDCNTLALQSHDWILSLPAGSVVRVKQTSGFVDDSRVYGVNISCWIPEGYVAVNEIHNGWDSFNSVIIPVAALRDETEIASERVSRVKAIKVQITATIHDYNSKPNTFKTAREANEAAAEEFGVQGVAIPIYVGRLKKGCYVLLQNDGDVVKYSSEGGRWLPISAEQQRSSEDILDAAALEAGTEAEKQAPAFEVGKKYYTRTFSGRREAGAGITVVSMTDKFVTFYDPATGGNTKRKIKTGDWYQHFTCDYGRYGSYTTSWFEAGGAKDGVK